MNDEQYSEKELAVHCFRWFGISSFREGQYPLIQAILQGENVLGILPTGAGKSICFQLPALMSGDISLVVTPLKSLMKDQVAGLHARGIYCADYLDSSRCAQEKEEVFQKVREGSVRILYISPERLLMRGFKKELLKAICPRQVAYFVIDEAHCISQWGHDFRPAYREMYRVSRELGAKQMIAVTATASPKVKRDILQILQISERHVFASSSMDRRELHFHVLEVPRPYYKERALKSLIEMMKKRYPTGSGLVFTVYAAPEGKYTSPLGTRFIHEYLREQGIDSWVYHSKLEDGLRLSIQEKYKDSQDGLLVATNGFGMGIDKPDIRYVIHLCYPPSLEAYYQEAGRAGRDRKEAQVLILVRRRSEECLLKCTEEGLMDPPCVAKWECFYEEAEKCDFGMQAKFLYDAYPSQESLTEEICELIEEMLYNKSQDGSIYVYRDGEKAGRCHMFLHAMARYGLIQNFGVDLFSEKTTRFHFAPGEIPWDKEYLYGQTQILSSEMVRRKEHRYADLEEMRRYAESDTGCRRQRILDYFQDEKDYGPQGCGSCDIDGERFLVALGDNDEKPEWKTDVEVRKASWWKEEDLWKFLSILLGLVVSWRLF